MTFIQFLSYKIIVIKAIRFIFNLFVVTFNILSTGFVLFYMVPIKTFVHKHMSTKWQKDKKQKEFEVTKGQSESVYRRRTDNTMAKIKRTKGQTTIYKTYI